MILRYLPILSLCIILFSCQTGKTIIKNNVGISVYTSEEDGKLKAYAMPEITYNSALKKHERRFMYVLMNLSEIHSIEKKVRRDAIFALYPDTLLLKEKYLKEYCNDKILADYFKALSDPVLHSQVKKKITFTVDEMMDVASKFFYCDEVLPDSSVQAHVCLGLNGISEAKWEKDYVLLEAFCYDGIFTCFEKEDSQIWDSFVTNQHEAIKRYRDSIKSLEQYLKDVQLDLFERMRKDEILRKELLEFYSENIENLPFVFSDYTF